MPKYDRVVSPFMSTMLGLGTDTGSTKLLCLALLALGSLLLRL